MDFITNSGWLPSPKDARDYPLSAIVPKPMGVIPERVSLESHVLRIDNQLSKPWCVAFGVCNSIEFAMRMRGIAVPEGGFSKAWLYARCKQLDGIPNQEGTFIRVALGIALNEGLCPDYLCPTAKYLQESALPALTTVMKTEAAKYRINAYARLQDAEGYASADLINQAIANQQFVVIGSWVEQDNWLDGDAYITIPKGNILGGHCTYLFDYDNSESAVGHMGFDGDANSWGTEWGNNGKANMAHDYINYRDLDGVPALQEAWTFTVNGAVIDADTSCKDGYLWLNKTVALLDGVEVTLDCAPLVDNIKNRVLVPLRFMAEHMGYKVEWDSLLKQVHFWK